MPKLSKKQTADLQPNAGIRSPIRSLCGPNAVIRESARKALVAQGKVAVELLIKLLSDKKPHVRWEAAKVLGEIRDPTAAPALVNALEDEDQNVRWLAAIALIAMKRKGLKPLLLAMTQRPDSIWLRQGAHHICHELGKKDCISKLTPVLNALEQSDPEMAVPLAAYQVIRSLNLSSS